MYYVLVVSLVFLTIYWLVQVSVENQRALFCTPTADKYDCTWHLIGQVVFVDVDNMFDVVWSANHATIK